MTQRITGSFIYREFMVDLVTTENDGRWECHARFKSNRTTLAMSHSRPKNFNGFPSREEAETDTIKIVKSWINVNRPDSPRTNFYQHPEVAMQQQRMKSDSESPRSSFSKGEFYHKVLTSFLTPLL